MKAGQFLGLVFGSVSKTWKICTLYPLGEGFKEDIIREVFLEPVEGEENVYRPRRTVYVLSEDYCRELGEGIIWINRFLHCALTGCEEDSLLPVPVGRDGFLELLQRCRGQLMYFKNRGGQTYLYYRYTDNTKAGSVLLEDILGGELSIPEAEKFMVEYGCEMVED